ncbi:hypothetical protein ANCCAN_23711 [Ancylostoma caninum]|uniref:Uncharacterized protein n=1 Tax=Ancylostoma caninum TaxID=29170 RepID=A0A368FK27_ANCCA|nr:hypothetical protein ANCCAN_23711 [Ancylostoma caninum]
MPLQSVIAQIGGQFSLWAGGSLISICQIVIYLSRYLLSRCERVYRHKKGRTARRYCKEGDDYGNSRKRSLSPMPL